MDAYPKKPGWQVWESLKDCSRKQTAGKFRAFRLSLISSLCAFRLRIYLKKWKTWQPRKRMKFLTHSRQREHTWPLSAAVFWQHDGTKTIQQQRGVGRFSQQRKVWEFCRTVFFFLCYFIFWWWWWKMSALKCLNTLTAEQMLATLPGSGPRRTRSGCLHAETHCKICICHISWTYGPNKI